MRCPRCSRTLPARTLRCPSCGARCDRAPDRDEHDVSVSLTGEVLGVVARQLAIRERLREIAPAYPLVHPRHRAEVDELVAESRRLEAELES